MARHYVDSAAGGANNGTSWVNAWTSLASSGGVAAGDEVLVDDGHSEITLASNISWSNGTLVAPVRIVCVDKATDLPSTGAVVGWNTGSLGPVGNLYCYGITWESSGSNLSPAAGVNGKFEAESCTFVATGSTSIAPSTGTRGWMVWKNCTVTFALAGSAAVTFLLTNANKFCWSGGSYVCRGTQTAAIICGNSSATTVMISGVAFIGTVTHIVNNSASSSNSWLSIVLNGCQLPAYTTLATQSHYHNRVELWGCATGTITTSVPGPEISDGTGGSAPTLSRYRTGGSDDGEQVNAYSWELVTNAGAADFVSPLVSPPITRWVDTGAQTVTVYVASGVTLQNDEFWLEVFSPSEAGSPTAQSRYQSTRSAILATPANLTTDATSTWNGTGVGTKQQVAVCINPTLAGPVTVRVFLAKASTTVYVDPILNVDGDVAGLSRFVEGVQTFDETASDGGGGSSNIFNSSVIF